jgi:hypothetical protein
MQQYAEHKTQTLVENEEQQNNISDNFGFTTET